MGGVKSGIDTGFKLANAALEEAAAVPRVGAIAVPVGEVQPARTGRDSTGRCTRGVLDAKTAQTRDSSLHLASKSTSNQDENHSPVKYQKALGHSENGAAMKVEDI